MLFCFIFRWHNYQNSFKFNQNQYFAPNSQQPPPPHHPSLNLNINPLLHFLPTLKTISIFDPQNYSLHSLFVPSFVRRMRCTNCICSDVYCLPSYKLITEPRWSWTLTFTGLVYGCWTKNRGGKNPPKWMVKIMENPFNIYDLGSFPLFLVQHPYLEVITPWTYHDNLPPPPRTQDANSS